MDIAVFLSTTRCGGIEVTRILGKVRHSIAQLFELGRERRPAAKNLLPDIEYGFNRDAIVLRRGLSCRDAKRSGKCIQRRHGTLPGCETVRRSIDDRGGIAYDNKHGHVLPLISAFDEAPCECRLRAADGYASEFRAPGDALFLLNRGGTAWIECDQHVQSI